MVNYISVTEYAKLYGKDPGNIRRLLIAGRIKGIKIGNQWAIKEDTKYPKDKREISGKYHNSKKLSVLKRDKELMATLTNMANELKEIYGPILANITIYGSYARGTQTDESDVDIAIMLKEKASEKVNNKMINCVAKHELECGKTLSAIDIDLNMYNKWKSTLPFYRNISKEGIVLWKAV